MHWTARLRCSFIFHIGGPGPVMCVVVMTDKVPIQSETPVLVERTYGVTPGAAVAWLCLLLGVFALATFATVHSVKHGHDGWGLALRLLFIWVVPVGGPVAVMLYLRRAARPHSGTEKTTAMFKKSKCNCGALEMASREVNHPIRWDERMNEYYIAHGKSGHLMVYYCPVCGGRAPESRRASMFAHVTQEEEIRIYGLFRGVRTVSDVVARFGPPDQERDIAAAVRRPGSRAKAERGEAFRGLVYKSLSPVADIVFQVGYGDSVTGTWIQKYVGDKKG